MTAGKIENITVTDEMLIAYIHAHYEIIRTAMRDYSKTETISDDARRAGIKAAIIEMERLKNEKI